MTTHSAVRGKFKRAESTAKDYYNNRSHQSEHANFEEEMPLCVQKFFEYFAWEEERNSKKDQPRNKGGGILG
jgi:hypothetical protein